MLSLKCNKKGVGMVEVLIAIFLTTTAILALLGLQNPGWRNMAKADYTGRASGILYKMLEKKENVILNPCNLITTGTCANVDVYTSGQSAKINGDVTYHVVTCTNLLDASNTNAYIVSATVTWDANSTGISESMIVTRQEAFRYPSTGADNSVTVSP